MPQDDWRVQFVGTQAGTGNRVSVAVQGKWDDAANVHADMPAPACLMLDLSNKQYARSVELRDTIGSPTESGSIDAQTELFDYIQDYFSSVILAFTCLEMTCNTHIQATDTLTVEGHRSTETYTGEQIERWVNLDDKINFVAERLGTSFDRGGEVWQNYKKLEDMRNRLVHLKNSDRESHGHDDNNIWTFALCQSPLNPCQIALGILNEMYSSSTATRPKWLDEANTLLI